MKPQRLSALIALGLAGSLWGCSGDDPDAAPTDTGVAADAADDTTETDTGDDTGDDTGAADDTGEDADTSAETDTSGDASDLAAYGEPCTEDRDCQGNVCLRIAAGLDEGFCSGYCFEATDCPDDAWDCIFLRNSGADASFLCVPDNLCIDGDDDNYGIGPGCVGSDCDDTMAGINPGADELCDAVDNDCDGSIDDYPVDANLECTTGFEGICSAGRTVCDGGLLECAAATAPEPELCDGVDNDCDGTVDLNPDGSELSIACYGGPAGTADVGQCHGGTRNCVDGTVTECEGQVLPFPELCDGIDNDCDGETDETSTESGFQCATGQAGECARGVTSCEDGAVVCLEDVSPVAELCDGLDNDCDGSVDEDFSIGGTCFAGEGICRQVGIYVCDADPAAPSSCDAVASAGNPAETCDYLDDDCDGEVDEDFRNAAGGYDGTENCGGCGVDCNALWVPDPASLHVVPFCASTGGVNSCDYGCEDGWEDLDFDPSNGCEFSPDPDAAYVDATGGVDSGTCGAVDAPCASIGQGVTRASALGRTKVLVADGLYREDVVLQDGISVLGGHNSFNWTRNPDLNVSVITGLAGAADTIAVDAHGIVSPTEFSGFTVNAANAGPGGNSIGIYVADCDADFTVRDNRVYGGNGGTGTPGDDGVSGNDGVDGTGGGASYTDNCRTDGEALRNGGTGGARTCQDPATFAPGVTDRFTDVSGGTGGGNVCPSVDEQETPPGQDGANGGGTGGAGGEGGWGHISSTSGSCSVTGGGVPETGTVGGNGAANAAQDGGGGGACTTTTGAIVAGQWRGDAGAAGTHGRHGAGGGGGGGGAGQDLTDNARRDIGGAGGGGGSGGCAASAGAPGSAGGGSFPIFVYFTSTPASVPVITDNSLARGNGGDGGDGGNGGAGGEAGLGGAGGPLATYNGPIYCVFPGAPGGAGARGGHGGGGGGACGGNAYDIFVWGLGGRTQNYASTNTFSIPAGTSTAGRGGSGGNSNNTTVGLGDAGTLGASGQVFTHN